MIEISMNQIREGLLMYGIVMVILYIGTKLHVSWIDIGAKISKKEFFLKWLLCFVLDIIVFLMIIVSELVKNQNDIIYNSVINIGAIFAVFCEILVISIIVQRYCCIIHSKFILVSMLCVWVFNDFLKILNEPVLLIIILMIGMLPDKNALTKEQ